MTYSDLLNANQALQQLDTQSMAVGAKVTLYRQLQYAEQELQSYQKALQDITGGAQSLEDLDADAQAEVEELLQTRVEAEQPKPLEQAELPDSITVQQIAALDRAGLVSLD